jgi:dGTPase
MAERTDRRYSTRESDIDDEDERSPFERDRDRILYSTNFRRLGRVTQVGAPDERALIHNRLTHSLEVAQIGRGLVNRLLRQPANHDLIAACGGLDPAVVEAAALAHDLGHPPFGHVAESELDLLLTSQGVRDGFEGNAQSFRIVTKLGVQYRNVPGFNLTRATLAAVLKYPWPRSDAAPNAAKWGAYASEEGDLRWAREMMPAESEEMCLEAALMDWADDIAYAVHDLDDFFRTGLIPLDRLAIDEGERHRFLDAEGAGDADREEVTATIDHLAGLFPLSRPYRGTRTDRAVLRSFTSRLIGDYIGSVALAEVAPGRVGIRIEPGKAREVALLKGLTWHYVITSPSLVSQRFGQRALIRSLFAVLMDAAMTAKDGPIFPVSYQEELKGASSDAARLRIIVDYIASMSEIEAVELHRQLTGQDLGATIERML